MNPQVLKPCPFCGQTPPLPEKVGGSNERNGYNFKMVITCKCGITLVKDSSTDKQGWCNDTGQALKTLINTWNSRTK